MVTDSALMDYVLVSRKVVGSLLDVRVLRGEGGGMSDHYLVESRLRVSGRRWDGRRVGCVREGLKVSELRKSEKAREFQEKLTVEWNVVKEQEIAAVEEEWNKFKNGVLGCASEVCGVRRLGGARRKGSEWWNEEMREAVLVKKRAYERWLQKKDDVTYEYYKGERNRVKRMVKEAKLRADERWGQKMTESFGENKKMFWKEVKRVRKGCSRLEERVKAGDGRLLVKSEDVRGRWAEYFKDLLNVEDGREAVVVAVGRERRMPVLGMLNDGYVVTEEVEGAVAKMKSGKSPGLDGCTVECILSLVGWQ